MLSSKIKIITLKISNELTIYYESVVCDSNVWKLSKY